MINGIGDPINIKVVIEDQFIFMKFGAGSENYSMFEYIYNTMFHRFK